MEVTWEALDVDDSDIPSLSLLRPCKRPKTAAATNPQPFLQPCSNRSSETLAPKPADSRRIIPGPAGAVQSAMVQKARDREKENRDFEPASTQDYIRRAVENAPEFDDDFTRTPWLSALHFIGTVDGVVPSVPLSSLSQCENVGKVDRVVAIIKSRSHSALGGLTVTLKDPTGTIGASVHHKLLSENQFAKDFVIGSILILEKVAIFSPSKSVHYLNILPSNLVKVFKNDMNTSSEDDSNAHSVNYVTPGKGESGSPENMFIPESGSCEEILNVLEVPIDGRGRSECCSQSKSGERDPESLSGSSRCGLNAKVIGKEPLIISQGVRNGLSEDIIMEKAGADHQDFSNCIDRSPKACDPKEKLLRDDTDQRMMTNHDEEIQGNSTIQSQKQQVTPSLPLWTDEQLKELFAGHDDDDSAFF